MPTLSNMTGKVALVTGAAGGLGQATALKLAQAGADVCVVDVKAADLEVTATQLRSLGVQVHVYGTDLSIGANCAKAVTATVEAFGRLDALCNVAGIFLPNHTADMPVIDFEKTLAVNLSAPFYLIQAAIPHLLNSKGAVVNVTSCAALIGQAYCAAYCATKAGLNHMTKALAMEYMHQGIRFNAVAPGGMMTPLTASLKVPAGVDGSLMKRFSALRGLNEVDEVADMVAFLASDAAKGYHGAIIAIDQGITAG
jgi:NAD(P)-dependent dehydrogenase (short-subunit alcohol dehydrogenase family)